MKVRLKHYFSAGFNGYWLFQFHEGPIKTRLSGRRRQTDLGFNSMKVRLKQVTQYPDTEVPRFQFHEGPIKTGLSKGHLYRLTSFQFHEGPIKTVWSEKMANQQNQVSIP